MTEIQKDFKKLEPAFPYELTTNPKGRLRIRIKEGEFSIRELANDPNKHGYLLELMRTGGNNIADAVKGELLSAIERLGYERNDFGLTKFIDEKYGLDYEYSISIVIRRNLGDGIIGGIPGK